MVSLTKIPSNRNIAEFVLLVSMFLGSVRLQVLVTAKGGRKKITSTRGFPCSSVDKEPACNSGNLGSIHESGRSPGERNGNPLQHSCLENPMERGVWQATIHGVERVRHDLATKLPSQGTQ